MIKRLIKEKRLVFVNENNLCYTDRAGKDSTYTFAEFGKHIVTELVVNIGNDKNLKGMAESVGLTSLAAISVTGVSEESVIEVLKEEYKRSKKSEYRT